MKSRLAACFVLWAVFFFGILPPPLPAQEIDKGVEKAVEKTEHEYVTENAAGRAADHDCRAATVAQQIAHRLCVSKN